jgi:2-oxo-4-hydroxy-4-carboxy-5-ureidoimidazoline decarboxylase
MLDPHALLNALAPTDARAALARCCGASAAALDADAEAVFATLGRQDLLEAFSHHPRIGARAAEATAALQATAAWSSQEQARVADADADTKEALRAANEEYLRRFGYIFIVCATGKSAAEMLELLRARLPNDDARELAIAAREQLRITRLRLEKLAS